MAENAPTIEEAREAKHEAARALVTGAGMDVADVREVLA